MRYPGFAAAAFVVLACVSTAAEAASPTGDWPCVQRKVPEMMAGQVWNKGDIPDAAKALANDKKITDLVDFIAARRTPLEEVQGRVKEFADAAGPDRAVKLQAAFLALLDKLNRERGQVISGIERYGRHQIDLADKLRKEQHELDKMQADPKADPSALQDAQDQLAWDARIFEDRKASLSSVCEVPVLIEQRLGQVTRLLEAAMP
ncbi:MAG: hypothetical protein U1E46_08285 [Hyphomicrobiales bacterium]